MTKLSCSSFVYMKGLKILLHVVVILQPLKSSSYIFYRRYPIFDAGIAPVSQRRTDMLTDSQKIDAIAWKAKNCRMVFFLPQ